MNWLACSETASRLRAHAGGSVAQLVEQWPFKPLVRGSSPRAPTIFCPNITETFPVKQPNRAKLLTIACTVLTQTEKGKSTDETESNPLLSALWQRCSKGFHYTLLTSVLPYHRLAYRWAAKTNPFLRTPCPLPQGVQVCAPPVGGVGSYQRCRTKRRLSFSCCFASLRSASATGTGCPIRIQGKGLK